MSKRVLAVKRLAEGVAAKTAEEELADLSDASSGGNNSRNEHTNDHKDKQHNNNERANANEYNYKHVISSEYNKNESSRNYRCSMVGVYPSALALKADTTFEPEDQEVLKDSFSEPVDRATFEPSALAHMKQYKRAVPLGGLRRPTMFLPPEAARAAAFASPPGEPAAPEVCIQKQQGDGAHGIQEGVLAKEKVKDDEEKGSDDLLHSAPSRPCRPGPWRTKQIKHPKTCKGEGAENGLDSNHTEVHNKLQSSC